MADTAPRPRRGTGPTSIAGPGILLGAGVGGFIDGIFAHQILQWHGMLTQLYPNVSMANMELNMLADGLFHLVTLLFVVVGVLWLWGRARRGGWVWSWRSVVGWMLAGWGVFNLAEGTLNHHILQVHRVNPEAASPLAWDIGFLVLGALLVLGGWLLARTDEAVHDSSQVGAG
jgi:uncharacterized membrane protein